ncbi:MULTISPECIES: DUF2776 family protein [Streptomyces]|uniref:DUF2776 family protein n=1 Tax=Streptomyces TaxID=1883 RepID=UPI0004A98698|nr:MULTISPECIES: DUF2776 family protein [unclassified Streptomyces]KDQ68762.1 hypothetical protein DT87_16675 [Streptomyces sp. NTK 937]MYR74400.1 DUF2776 family protein [Streptomyces sp. SID4925]SBV03781.1 Protein of unknown function (DUF2776) [Streptomyces sp. OspMP-M45]SCD40752.1 Protein of unknown function [Streptomyces sp. PpalLS-921]
MNYKVSVLFRAIPVLMGAISAALGGYVLAHASGPSARVAGLVLIFLAAICLCLFSTAATIIRQLIGRFSALDRVLYPALGFAVSGVTAGYGLSLLTETPRPPPDFVAGHVVFGVGMICVCVSSVATASTRFVMITENSALPEGSPPRSPAPFGPLTARVLLALPALAALVTWVWAFVLLAGGGGGAAAGRFTAGHVMAGLALVCTCLIGLVASILRQIQNTYTRRERVLWPAAAACLGAVGIVWGLLVLALHDRSTQLSAGYVVIGLGLICWSILSKVLLLALVWRRKAPLANRVPLIPVGTALLCLFLASFLFESADSAVVVAARVLIGLGGVCFSLFSIVSILESGTGGGDDDPGDGTSAAPETGAPATDGTGRATGGREPPGDRPGT